jgi:hypothetical protein
MKDNSFAVGLALIQAASTMFAVIAHSVGDDAAYRRLMTELSAVVADIYKETGLSDLPKEKYIAQMLALGDDLRLQNGVGEAEWPAQIEEK